MKIIWRINKLKFFISSLSRSNNGMFIEFKSRFNLCEFFLSSLIVVFVSHDVDMHVEYSIILF